MLWMMCLVDNDCFHQPGSSQGEPGFFVRHTENFELTWEGSPSVKPGGQDVHPYRQHGAHSYGRLSDFSVKIRA